MEQIEKLIKKICKIKTWNIGGFKYKVVDTILKETFFEFVVNCDLPENGQSYAQTVFQNDFEEIIKDISELTGSKIAFSVEFLVNGFPAKEVYLSPSDRNAIDSLLGQIKTIQISQKEVGVSVRGFRNTEYFLVDVISYRHEKKSYTLHNDEIRIHIYYDVLSVRDKKTGKELDVPLDWVRRVGSGIRDSLGDETDYFADMSDSAWGILSEPLKLRGGDMYVNIWGEMRYFLDYKLSYTSKHVGWKKALIQKPS